MSGTHTLRILTTRRGTTQTTQTQVTQQASKIVLAVDMLVVWKEGTMDMMNGESAMSSVREKKQDGEKKSEKRNSVLSNHTVYGGIKGMW